jgi:flagellar motor switch/type III secretory pathway protein FliN
MSDLTLDNEEYLLEDEDVSVNHPHHDSQLISPAQVELRVKCEVGRLSLSLSELLQLKVGSVVDLIKWPGAVKLTANGVYFAEGVLVELDGMLAVKITTKYQYGGDNAGS